MSGVDIDPSCHPRVQPRYFCRNGQLVSAQYQQTIAALLNQICRYRTKQYGMFGGDVIAPSEDKLWRVAGHVGPMAGSIVARVDMAPANMGTSTNNPYIGLTLYDSSGNQVGFTRGHFGYSFGLTPTEAPNEWGMLTLAIDARPLRDTSIRATIQANEEARAVGCTLYEYSLLPDTDNGYVSSGFSVCAPILDADRSSLITLAHSILKRGGPALFAFSSDTDASAPTNTSATYRNIFYDAAIGGEPRGFTIDRQFCNRKTKTTVPVKIEAFAKMSAGGGATGEVRVIDGAGNTYATFSITGTTAEWKTPQTANLPADSRMYYVEHKGDGAATCTTYAVSVFSYAA